MPAGIESSYSSMGTGTTRPPRTATEPEGEPFALALVVPTYCEAENIGALLGHIRSALDPLRIRYQIIVVDDDSRDGTGEAVAAIAREDPRVRLLVRKGERGLSGAILDGWAHANAEVLGVMDADLQHPPALLPQLYAAIRSGSDMAIGSRYTAGGGIGDWNIIRRFLSFAAVRVTWPLQKRGVRARDPMSGFFMLRRACVQGIAFQRSGFKLLLEILVRGRIHSVQEIPFAFGLRAGGASKASLKVGWDYLRLLVYLYAGKIVLHRRKELHPRPNA